MVDDQVQVWSQLDRECIIGPVVEFLPPDADVVDFWVLLPSGGRVDGNRLSG